MTGPYPPQGPYPPPYGYPPMQQPPPDNNLVWAILATVFCCLPLGIVAIVKANQVNTLWYQGFHLEAQRAAAESRKWAMWSAISIAIIFGLYLLFVLIMVFAVGGAVWWPR